MFRNTFLLILWFVFPATHAFAQIRVDPVYSIWEVRLGVPVTQVSDAKVSDIACGTSGGPMGRVLTSFQDFLDCNPEETGLREVAFSYDDEQDYIARALESEYRVLQGGTSVFAHPVIVSMLIDQHGVAQGRRIFTDDRISDYERRTAFTLIRNFKARFSHWSLACDEIPMQEGEQPVGNQFFHERCSGQSPDGTSSIVIEASFLRKKGQRGLNLETQQVNTGYFESQTRFEELLTPYAQEVSRWP